MMHAFFITVEVCKHFTEIKHPVILWERERERVREMKRDEREREKVAKWKNKRSLWVDKRGKY